MAGMEWMDPPPLIRGLHHSAEMEYDEAVEKLKAQPGRWARLRKGSRDESQYPLKRRGCEVTARKVGEGRWDIYARWPDGETS